MKKKHNPTHSEATGVGDSEFSTLVTVGPGSDVPSAAIAQMVIRSGAVKFDAAKALHIPVMPLHDRIIGLHRLCPTTKSDFAKFMNQPTIEGSTATLIGPRHVLACAHSIAPSDLILHHFVFGRTDSAVFDVVDGAIVVPKGRYHTAKRLLGYVNTDAMDWAVIELFKDVADVEPLRLGRWHPEQAALYLGHPLGLPLKQANVVASDMSRTPPSYGVFVDNGSGGSGAPILQHGAVIGVVRGDAKVSPDMLGEHDGKPCVDPCLGFRETPQPFTPATHIAPALPQLFGW